MLKLQAAKILTAVKVIPALKLVPATKVVSATDKSAKVSPRGCPTADSVSVFDIDKRKKDSASLCYSPWCVSVIPQRVPSVSL